MIDIEKTRREQLRWVVLLALNHTRPYEANESSLLAIARGVYPDASQLENRRHLDYLEDRGLVKLRREPSGMWWAGLTRYGTDMAEYTIDCAPGIGRPAEKYW